MHVILSLLAVCALIVIAYAGVAGAGLQKLFGVVIPYLALVTFFVGLIYRVLSWARSAVPFRIPTTCGQVAGIKGMKPNKFDNPTTGGAVIVRMLAEIFLMRSLFRNTQLDFRSDGPTIRYGSEKFLWLAAMAFHYAFLTVLIWHLRFFLEPVPKLVQIIDAVDSFAEVGLPQVLLSGLVLLAAAGYLLQRRLINPQVRYISLMNDYFPLFLILAIAITGILMRYFLRVDVEAIKQLTMGLATFNPVIPDAHISSLFYIHLFLVSVLFAYFPFSKLVHLGGIFMSPTRNLANNSRAVRHINPWNYPVKIHTYEEYEDEFRDLMIEAGIPVEKMPEEAAGEEAPAETPAE